MVVILTVVVALIAVQTLLGVVPGTEVQIAAPSIAVIGSLAIQVFHSVPSWRRWRGWWTLAAQLALLPFGGTAEFAAATTLLVIRRWYRWPMFAVIMGYAAFTVHDGNYFRTLAYLAFAPSLSLIIFALTRLSELRTDLAATRTMLGRTQVAEERARASRTLDFALGTALARIIALAAEKSTTGIAAISRYAASKVRRVAPTPDPPAPREMTPRLVLPVLVIAHVQGVVTSMAYVWQAHMPGWQRFGMVLVAVVALALHFHHIRPRPPSDAPMFLQWTLPVQFVVACLPLLAPDRPYPDVIPVAAASLLVTTRPRISWPMCAVLAALIPACALWRGPSLAFGMFSLVVLAFGTTMYAGPAVLTRLVHRIREARQELAAVAVAAERQRIARDVHDLLGANLTAITLRAETGADPDDITALASRALRELRAIPDGDNRLRLDAELASAHDLLAAANITVDATIDGAQLPPPVESILATVLREAVTNMVRHSRARHCHITLEIGEDAARLRVTNDGAEATGASSGTGLANLTARTRRRGGTFQYVHHGDRFELEALQPIRFGGDADGVEPVAGAELADDRCQVIAHRAL